MTLTLDKPQPETAPFAADTPSQDEVREYHWTVDALYRALDAGVFEHPERLELIQGRIFENMAQDPIHRSMRVRFAHHLRLTLEPRLVVIEECPIHIASDGELTPDIVVLSGTVSDYDERHPSPNEVVVVVEVSNTTVAYDLGGKALQYAQAGITDYWMVVLGEAAIVRHREPTPSGYKEVEQLSGEDRISPLAMPEAGWTVDTLLGRKA